MPRLHLRHGKAPVRSPQPHLVLAVDLPQVLSSLVAHLDWPDLLSLLNTCSHCRNIFLAPSLREVILSRLVPGYADALRLRDPTNYHDLPVSLHDLDLLLISHRFPLHRYPTHALKIMTASYPTRLEENYITSNLICLSQAHSRFVLLLQALVHSSSSPIPPEKDDFRHKSHRLSVFVNPFNSEPLEFPAPLSYLKEHAAHDDPIFDSTLVSKNLKRDFKNNLADSDISPSSAVGSPSMTNINNNVQEPRSSRQVLKKISTRSFFRKNHVTPPLPEAEPRALRIYSTYRRTGAYTNNRISRVASDMDVASSAPSPDPKLPKRHLAPSRDSSSSSRPVTSSSSSSSSHLPQSRTGESSISSYTSPSNSSSHSQIGIASPHDLRLTTSRVRAPILRVFVPCTSMEVDSESVLLCERQLVDAGLWQHLSTGDIVCNLGYIPPTPEDTPAASAEDDSACAGSSTPYRRSTSSRGIYNNTTNNSRKWLLFDGNSLVPYTAPDPLPIENPISLPSPYYYAHLMPHVVPGGNANRFRFMIGNFPPVKYQVPQLTLINLSSRVRSAKSTDGWVEVKRWVWTARFVRYRSGLWMDPAEDIGAGWLGEWVLEGVGTSEGRQMLLDILHDGIVPGGPREWELVRERSGGGRIWLRLIT
ncbi:hypothetical protein Agabi119p4_5520 [Agaricus bisporus var. burnettii]|uniref:F-box domain-containing protein n=1 Tax=Agaricus bisporus var. burnettii TaxID=192524 RepID=A0A8H7KGM0_AGABI|nr:hypothetical protein Agabi119p4_5520 [Agaricus bisporus var. burnettii]